MLSSLQMKNGLIDLLQEDEEAGIFRNGKEHF